LLVVSDVGRHRTLKQLAALTPDQVHRLVEQSLEHMATCPTAIAA
jgi:hypothetical protein